MVDIQLSHQNMILNRNTNAWHVICFSKRVPENTGNFLSHGRFHGGTARLVTLTVDWTHDAI